MIMMAAHDDEDDDEGLCKTQHRNTALDLNYMNRHLVKLSEIKVIPKSKLIVPHGDHSPYLSWESVLPSCTTDNPNFIRF